MELYGSLSNISGSVTASAFTGSFIGDGSGLTGIQAAGVTGLNLSQISTGSVSASLSPNGFNVNTGTSITGSLNVSGTVISQTTPLVSGSSQIEITGTTGYSTFSSSIATTDSNQELRLNSIETSTGSLNSFTSSIDTTIKNKLNTEGVISGSSQILNNSGIVSSSTQVTTYGFATTGSNTFKGTQLVSGSILPTDDNAYDLGSPSYQWRDVYISSGSLYVDGSKVLSSTAQELQITTDNGQSIKILEGTTDSIVLQTADGNIELKSSAAGDILLDPTNGKIVLKGTVELLNGNKIQSSVGGTPVVFANDIVVSGSIDLTGTIEGIDLTAFSSSLNTRLGTLETSTGSLNSFTSSTNSRLSSIESTTSSLNTYTSSNNTRLDVIETSTSSLNTYTSSTNTRLSSIETTTGSLLSVNTTQNGRLDSLETTSGSILTTNTTQNNRLNSIEGVTGSYATTGSNIFQGTQTITGSLYISQDLVVAGSSSIQHISSSIVNITDNIITVNALNPSVRFGGLAVIDSGSSPQVSGSMLFDSVNNQWLFVHQNQGTITSSVLLMGPETYDNIGNESYITANRLVKSTGIEHLAASNISDNGTTVTILSNTIVNGTLSATGTTLVSGSSQIVFSGLSGVPSGLVSGSSQVSFNTISDKPTLVSGSSQVVFSGLSGVPSGLISGSSQVLYGSITNVPSGIVSGSSQITFSGISGLPTLVSGSSQISFAGLSNVPGGLVSGSSQIDLTNTTNYASGIKTRLDAVGVLSGSAQVSYGSITGVPSGIVSGSSQITYGSISGIPSGIVSGSSQITLSSTTGFSTYLDQSVKSGSTVTFAGITNTGAYSGSGGSFSHNIGNPSSTTELFVHNGANTPVPFRLTKAGYSGAGTTYGILQLYMNDNTVSNGSNLYFCANNSASSFIEYAGIGMQIKSNTAGSETARLYFYRQGRAVNGTFDSDGTLRVVGDIYVQGNGTTSGTQVVYNSGTWGINISGNAATATNASSSTNSTNSGYLGSADLRIIAPNSHDAYKLKFGFTSFNNNNTSPWADYLHLRSYSDNSGGADNLLMFSKSSLSMRLYQQSFGSATAYSSYVDILTTGNYSSYALPLGGGTVTSKVNIGSGGSTNAGLLNVTGQNDNQVNITHDSSWGLLLGYCNEASPSGYHGPNHAAIINVRNASLHFGINNSSNVQISSGGHFHPSANNTYDCGTSSLAWRNVYTNDLHLSNMNKPEGNDVDGTNGNWTIQEGAENLYIINNNNGKKYKIKLEEI